MRVELFPFQKVALSKLRLSVATALGNYKSTHAPQVVSYTAPTGAGKTIIMASLIESVYYGDGNYPDQPEAIFIWLSDSPQLNEQSKLKIDMKAEKIALDQCVTISDDSFDREVLEDGHIYFLNTQKLSKSSNLTKHSDGRQYTIWETLANTIREKSDHLYFIIDEAHRGAQKPSDLTKNTTIMQKFLKGSPDDKLPPMPVVIGMTATWARFNRLAEGIHSTTHYVETKAEEVRASGLLKDRIVITYPETSGNDMAVLQAATDEWIDKCQHWYQYCYEQHYGQVNPVFVIQVQNGTTNRVSMTDLDECVRTIEERMKDRFLEGQVVHSFGEGTPALTINGLNVPYVEPSRIADDKRIKVVFFKETLTTGWDCPRAETMMSFRVAKDHTYIAQLLGRMVRTPTQQHINVDDTLNDVHLYLPQFDEHTVYDVVEALKSTEGANIPTEVESEMIGADGYMTGDQLIKYLHISKRKLKYLMENNYIPHQDSGQKTHKYFVRIEDAEEFDKRQHTDVKLKNELKGLFTSKTEHHPVPLIVITDDICDKFKVFLNDFFKEEQEALTVSRICQLTNFNAETIYRLIAEGTLYGTKARGKMYCSKSDLIDYLSSESTLRNPTCEGYRSLVRAFKRKRSDDTYNEQRRERRRIEREKKGSDT